MKNLLFIVIFLLIAGVAKADDLFCYKQMDTYQQDKNTKLWKITDKEKKSDCFTVPEVTLDNIIETRADKDYTYLITGQIIDDEVYLIEYIYEKEKLVYITIYKDGVDVAFGFVIDTYIKS